MTEAIPQQTRVVTIGDHLALPSGAPHLRTSTFQNEIDFENYMSSEKQPGSPGVQRKTRQTQRWVLK